MRLPFANTYEQEMRRFIKDLKADKKASIPEWMDKEVFEDVLAALDYSSRLKENMGKNLSFVLLFGGVMRTPFESHRKSDIDILLVYSSHSGFIRPDEARMSVLSYPESFLYSTIGGRKPESSFLRNVFLQAQATLEGSAGKARYLRWVAQKNFTLTDLAPLILHRIKKYKLDVCERTIDLVAETLGVLPWVLECPSAYEEIIDAVFRLGGSAATNIYR